MLSSPTTAVPISTSQDGVIHVGGTRVTLDTVIAAFLEGATPEEIVSQYPTLTLGDVYAVIGYYLHNQTKVDAYLLQRQKAAVQIQLENESRFPAAGVRARLLARERSSK